MAVWSLVGSAVVVIQETDSSRGQARPGLGQVVSPHPLPNAAPDNCPPGLGRVMRCAHWAPTTHPRLVRYPPNPMSAHASPMVQVRRMAGLLWRDRARCRPRLSSPTYALQVGVGGGLHSGRCGEGGVPYLYWRNIEANLPVWTVAKHQRYNY